MKGAAGTVFIVDDDAPFRKSMARLVRSFGYAVEAFASAADFLARDPEGGPCCLVLDVRMPGVTGPDLQHELARRGAAIPIIFLTGLADVTTGVGAMKDGAVDYLLKPVDHTRLFQAVDAALDRDRQEKQRREEVRRAQALAASLTPREREVLAWLITGMLNKQIACATGITERTVKAHRGQVMQKLGAGSVAELVRFCQLAGIAPAQPLPH
jgi:FixJ family two-component response regulator